MMVQRTEGEAGKAPFVPTEEWIEAFTGQMGAPEFFPAMRRYAERRGRMLALVKAIDPGAYAKHAVQDVIDDTLEGRIAWDPGRVDLKKHVRDAIRSRSRHEYKRACKRRHRSLDAGGLDLIEEQIAGETHETEIEAAERRAFAADVLDQIRARVADDPEVCLLIDAFEGGAESRAEVLEAVALTKLQYDAARKRLERVVDELPNLLITGALRNR